LSTIFLKKIKRYCIMIFMKKRSINFGERLKTIRRSKGFTQYQLADMLNTSQRMIAHYEKDGNRPRLDKVKDIANALNVSVEDFLEDSKPVKKEEDVSYKIMKKVRIIEKLPVRDQKAIFRLINSLAEKNKIKEG
jgi:transcriptional regulator with XRE-family HTH domain